MIRVACVLRAGLKPNKHFANSCCWVLVVPLGGGPLCGNGNKFRKVIMQIKKMLGATMGLLAAGSLGVQAATTADVIFVVDESGSMSGEHAWLATMVSQLDTALNTAGVTGNRFGLVGFGAANSGGHSVAGHNHVVGGGDFGTAAQLATATGGLVLTGGTEDGWDGIDQALNNYTFRSGAAVNIILVTDEDRDAFNTGLSYSGILNGLLAKGALLNAVINASFKTDLTSATANTVLGIDADGNGYKADGSGGYTSQTGGVATSGAGTTIADYVDLALASGGAAWNLNLLRAGGNTTASFTDAFVDIKVQEIVNQNPVPDTGSTMALLGVAMIGMVGFSRRFVQA